MVITRALVSPEFSRLAVSSFPGDVGLVRFDTVLDKGILDMSVGSEEQAIHIANAVAGVPDHEMKK